jgi:hypothetical protein
MWLQYVDVDREVQEDGVLPVGKKKRLFQAPVSRLAQINLRRGSHAS